MQLLIWKAEWRSVSTMPGALSVILHSALKMHKWFAGSLAILLKVKARKVPLEQRNNITVDITLINLYCTCCFSYITSQPIIVIIYTGTIVYRQSFYGHGSGPVFLDAVYCNGNELNIISCEHNRPLGLPNTDCTHLTDVGVECPGKES